MDRKLKPEISKLNSRSILGQYMVPYRADGLSRYKHIDELDLQDGKTIKATLSPVDTSVYPFEVSTEYVVSEADENRLDIIAYKVYGRASMYWAIAYANSIKDPLTEVTAGRILLIPSISTLKRFPNPLS